MMKIKKFIGLILISLVTSLFHGAPAANANQGVNQFSSSCSGRVSNGTFNANANFSTFFSASLIERWEYSYNNVNWIIIPNSKGLSSTSIYVTNWYENSFVPWVRNVSTSLVNGPSRQPSSSASTCSGASLVAPDTTPPNVVSFSSSTGNGAYKEGSAIDITATLSEVVTSGAQITVTLDTGETVLLTHSVSNNTLTGTYIVGAGKNSSDLTVSSYTLTSAPVDVDGNTMNTTTMPTGSNNIAGAKAIVIDTTAPTVINVTSTPSIGTLKAGDVVLVRVEMSEAVYVTGTPQITLETGTTDRSVNYTSGSGTNTLTFSYTIQSGDSSPDITYVDTSSLIPNSGSIRDIAINNATLTLAGPSSSGSLGANSSIVVDTTAPSATLTTGSITSSDHASVTSSEVGTAYLVNNSVTVNNLASITGAADSLWNSVSIATGNTSTNLSATGLVPGIYRLYTVDTAGNLSAASADSLTVTLAATGTPDLAAASDLGSSNTDNNTSDDTPEISMSGLTAGAVITLTATPSSGSAVTCTFTATGTTGSCVFPVLANGTYSVVATQTYNNVSSSPSTALTGIVINKSSVSTPSTPDLDSTSDSAGASDSDNITSDNTPKINVSGSFSGTAVVTASKAGSANVTCTISSNTCTLGTLADGVWSISVTDTDAAGNASTSAALSITVDATAPSPTVAAVSVTTASGVTVRSSEAGTAYLVKSTVSVSGLSSITSAADDSMNQVSISTGATDTIMSTAGLVAGDYKLYVVDAAGNLSLASTNTVTVAVAAAPTVAATTAPAGTTTFGSTLTNAVTFNGVPTPTLSYQWKSCTNATDTSTACTDISGATGSSFIANAIDLVGKFIRVLVTAINGVAPDATAWSSPTAAITPVAPGVPLVGTPTLGDLQINVPVTAPASNGGSTILKYQFSTDGGATWMDRTDTATVSSPIAIKFLSTDGTTPIVAGTTYPVQIRAVNSASSPNGAGSASVSVTAATVPGAPTSVTATATGQSTATITFTAPTSNGNSTITSYTVTSTPGGVTVSGSSSPISVTGLSASTAYTFTVTASNAAGTSFASSASSSITTAAPPAPAPEPVCNAACVAAAEAKVVSDTAAKVAVEKVSVDMTAAEAAAKAAVDKAAAAAVAKAAADAAAAQAALVAKAAADAQATAVEAASKAAAALKSATTTAAAKATATATAAKAATTAAKAVQAAAVAAKVAATAKNTASNASKQVDIAIGALGSQTASASSAAQANAIAAAAKAAANAAARSAADAAAAAKVASNKANREATAAAARIASEQKEAADSAAAAKAAADADLKANELKIATAIESQKATEAVVAALNEKVALAQSSVKAASVAERVEIDKKMADVSTKIAELQKVADEVQVKADAAIAAQVNTRAVVEVATQNAIVQANEAVAVKIESITKTAEATKAAASASLATKVAIAAKAAAAKVPAKAAIASKPSTSTKKNSTKATISGLKPGQKVKVTVNVKGK